MKIETITLIFPDGNNPVFSNATEFKMIGDSVHFKSYDEIKKKFITITTNLPYIRERY